MPQVVLHNSELWDSYLKVVLSALELSSDKSVHYKMTSLPRKSSTSTEGVVVKALSIASDVSENTINRLLTNI